MKQRCVSDQPDLFRIRRPGPQLRAMEQTALMPLLRNLLLEILSGKTPVMFEKEGDDDQDRG